MTRRIQHCHKLVAKQAREACDELYELMMKDNVMYSAWRQQNPGANDRELRRRFVVRNWGKCIPFARTTLARMLTMPINESLKSQISEALILDAALVRGRGGSGILLGTTE